MYPQNQAEQQFVIVLYCPVHLISVLKYLCPKSIRYGQLAFAYIRNWFEMHKGFDHSPFSKLKPKKFKGQVGFCVFVSKQNLSNFFLEFENVFMPNF